MNKSAVVAGSAVLIGCVLVGDMLLRHMGSRPAVVAGVRNQPVAPTPVAAPAAPRAEVAPAPPPAAAYPSIPLVPAPVVTTEKVPAAPRQPAATKPVARVRPARRPPDVVPGAPEPIVPIDVARVALAYVGADPDAEVVWYAAINDPSLSAHARQDLIEDLNEDGFADPKNVTADELPLVVSRLELIEEVAPDAMDQVNADAFAEAYKDLGNMYVRLTGDQ